MIISKYYFVYETLDDTILNSAQTFEANLPHSIEALRGEIKLRKEFWKNKSENVDFSMEAFKPSSIKCLLTFLSVIPITAISHKRSVL